MRSCPNGRVLESGPLTSRATPLRGQSRYVWNRVHFLPYFRRCSRKIHMLTPLRFTSYNTLKNAHILYLAWGNPGAVPGIIWSVIYVCGNHTHRCCYWTRRVEPRGIPGATDTTRIESKCPGIMSSSKERPSNKAKTENRWQQIGHKYCAGTSVRVARVDVFTSCCCCTT